jgi:predicted Fe-Mo cluster-binding NifX family protein
MGSNKIPNSLDEIILRVLEPTIEACTELNKISHKQKYEPLDEITNEVLDNYSREIKNKIGNLRLSINDIPLNFILDDLSWYCLTRINVKCSNEEINRKYKTDKLSGYLYLDELENHFGSLVVENRLLDLYEQAYDERRNVRDPKAEKMYKIYSTFLQQINKFPSLKKIIYSQIGQRIVEILKEKGILIQKEECGEYIILTDHPEVQKVIKKFYQH